MTSQACGPGRQAYSFRDRIHPFRVFPQDRLPLESAGFGGVKVPSVTARVADQAVDIFKLLSAHGFCGRLAQSGMAGGTAFAYDLSPRVANQPDPVPGRAGAKVIHRVQLSELSSRRIDDLGRLPQPLVVLGMEEALSLLLVALQASGGAFVMLEVLLVRVFRLLSGAVRRNRRNDQKTSDYCVFHVRLPKSALSSKA